MASHDLVQLRLYPMRSNHISSSWVYVLQYRLDPISIGWFRRMFNSWNGVSVYCSLNDTLVRFTYNGSEPEAFLQKLKNKIQTVRDLDTWRDEQLQAYEKNHIHTLKRIIY